MPKEGQLGALWVKNSERGEYLTGKIQIGEVSINIVCFPNGYKKEDKHPDWIILRAKERQQPANTLPNEQPDV